MASHSDEFTKEMKTKLLQEKEQLERELNVLADQHNGDYQGKFPEYGRSDEDNATEIADFQDINATTETAEARLKEVDTALEQAKKGAYGVTDKGDLIPEDRLRANPAATTLVK